MPEQNPLEELMKKFSTELKYKVPLGLIPEEDREFEYEGIETALVLYWSYKHNLLNDNIQKIVDKVVKKDKKLTHAMFLNVMENTIGKVLESHMYNQRGKEFVVDYVAFTSQWHYQYHKDIEAIYPNIRSFSEIPQSKERYEQIFSLLDSRFDEYYIMKQNAFLAPYLLIWSIYQFITIEKVRIVYMHSVSGDTERGECQIKC